MYLWNAVKEPYEGYCLTHAPKDISLDVVVVYFAITCVVCVVF